jgi:hypothetical protein
LRCLFVYVVIEGSWDVDSVLQDAGRCRIENRLDEIRMRVAECA